MSAEPDFEKAKKAFDKAIEAFKGELDSEGALKTGLTASKGKKGQALAVVLDDALTFYRACSASDEGQKYFQKLLIDAGTLENNAKNPFNAISRYIWLRRFNQKHWDDLKKDEKQLGTARVAANQYATVMHRAAIEKTAIADMAKTTYKVKDAYGRIVTKKGLDGAAKHWKSNERYIADFPSDKAKKAPKHEAGLKALEELSGDGLLQPAFVRVIDGAEPEIVKFIDLAEHPDLLCRLYELFAPKRSKGSTKGSKAKADKSDNSLASLLKRVATFASLAGPNYAMRFVDASNSFRIHTGKRGTRNSVIGELLLPKREDVRSAEFVITSENMADARNILALSKKVVLEIDDKGLLFKLPEDGKAFEELLREKEEKAGDGWSVEAHTIVIPLPRPSFSLPIISSTNEPKWFSPRINADETLRGKILGMESEVNAMPRSEKRLYKFSLSKDKFQIRDLMADHSGYSEYATTVDNGPDDPIDIMFHVGVIPRALDVVRDFADGKPVTLSFAQNIIKLEAEGVSYYVPAMDDKDLFKTANVGEWNETKRTRREV